MKYKHLPTETLEYFEMSKEQIEEITGIVQAQYFELTRKRIAKNKKNLNKRIVDEPYYVPFYSYNEKSNAYTSPLTTLDIAILIAARRLRFFGFDPSIFRRMTDFFVERVYNHFLDPSILEKNDLNATYKKAGFSNLSKKHKVPWNKNEIWILKLITFESESFIESPSQSFLLNINKKNVDKNHSNPLVRVESSEFLGNEFSGVPFGAVNLNKKAGGKFPLPLGDEPIKNSKKYNAVSIEINLTECLEIAIQRGIEKIIGKI